MSETEFDPNSPTSSDDGIFGLPYTKEESKIIITPVPWEVTTSYGAGAALGPESILQASHQLDLFSRQFGKAYEAGYFMNSVDHEIKSKNVELKETAQWIMDEQVKSSPDTSSIKSKTEQINNESEKLNQWVYQQTTEVLKNNQLSVLLGGDHSTPYGHIQAIAEKHENNYSILHIDAHHDFRDSYQGFTHSHASIFYNVMQSEFAPKKITQVGIRDFCEEEFIYAKINDRIDVFYDEDLQANKFQNISWLEQCQTIAATLTDEVYISCDIDGLSPDFCPNTGTPVPGGISYDEFVFLVKTLFQSGKKIIGCDLVEVAPDPKGISEWDANVGARVLFQLCGWMIESQK